MRFHIGVRHTIVVAEMSEDIIIAALRDIEEQGLLEECTVAVMES